MPWSLVIVGAGMNHAGLADAYVSLLSRQPWHQFWTLTFDPSVERSCGGVHPEKADKAFRFFVSSLNRELWGPKWAKRPAANGGVVWVRGQEFHRSGRIHFHACAAAPTTDLNSVMRRLTWMDFWANHFGWARLEVPESQQDICGYVSKYVSKGGLVDFSANFGRVVPPSLF